MPFARVLRLLVLGAALPLLAASALAQTTTLEATGRRSYYDDTSKETVVTGNARLAYGDVVLTADEIRYSAATNLATATGNFVLNYASRRLVADRGTYNLATRAISVRNLRLGEFPVYLSGDTVEGTLDELVFTNATVFFRENEGYTPSIRAQKLTYAHGKIVRAEGLALGLLGGHFISFPHFEQALDAAYVSYLSGRIGYRGNLGVIGELGLHVPVAEGVKLGADLGLYT
jgi:LPS-assembly protein